MVAVPVATVLIEPEVEPIVAIAVLPLTQVPPAVAGSLRLPLDPRHIPLAPDIAPGEMFTVTAVVAVQPEPNP